MDIGTEGRLPCKETLFFMSRTIVRQGDNFCKASWKLNWNWKKKTVEVVRVTRLASRAWVPRATLQQQRLLLQNLCNATYQADYLCEVSWQSANRPSWWLLNTSPNVVGRVTKIFPRVAMFFLWSSFLSEDSHNICLTGNIIHSP